MAVNPTYNPTDIQQEGGTVAVQTTTKTIDIDIAFEALVMPRVVRS